MSRQVSSVDPKQNHRAPNQPRVRGAVAEELRGDEVLVLEKDCGLCPVHRGNGYTAWWLSAVQFLSFLAVSSGHFQIFPTS